jgi:D-apionolactonase
MTAPSRAARLFGTDEPVEPPRVLKAGDLTAELEAGNLRYIRYRGFEVMRAISFLVRDPNWATYNPILGNLRIEDGKDSFEVRYDAVTKDAKQEFRYSAVISGHADGRLSFLVPGEAATDFVTNRAGFVVLHPIAGVAGAPATVEEVSGKMVETRFPELISPGQPIFNMRAITHEFAPGARVTCRMEGDTFEMEDQRNWMDASYKTYVRPLALPWPYTLAKGDRLEQKVSLKIDGQPRSARAAGGAISVRLNGEGGRLPALGVGLAPEDAASALAKADVLRKAGVAHVVCHHDPRAGHDRESLERMVAVASAIGADPWLEAIVAKVDGFEDEIAELGKTVKGMGAPFKTVLLSPAPDLKSTQPTGPWPPCPPLRDVYRLARQHFPGARLGGGMFSFFTELNRKRPPDELLDFVSFTTSSLVHAGDDRSASEGLEALPYMAKSVKAFAPGKPFAVGPSAIGFRFNPYGAAPMPNPTDIRQAMNRNDPRQRGLLGAAWYLAYYAHFAHAGADAVALGGLTGPFGIVHSKASYPQAWFDEAGGIYPVFHVMRGLSRLAGRKLIRLDIGMPREVQGLAVARDGQREVWLANLTGDPVQIGLDLSPVVRAITLDAESFVAAAADPEFLDSPAQPVNPSAIALDAYAVMRLTA